MRYGQSKRRREGVISREEWKDQDAGTEVFRDLCVCACSCTSVCMHVRSCIWRPEVDAGINSPLF